MKQKKIKKKQKMKQKTIKKNQKNETEEH